MANEKLLIDANELLRFIENEIDKIGTSFNREDRAFAHAMKVVAKNIRVFPTVDAVEVVRCKDCKHMYCCSAVDRLFYCRHPKGLKGMPNIVEENPFCPYGERKDNV